jgi:hypothetical protein
MNATATPKTASTSNGRRPTLSDSIARLDQILDGLGEAIPQLIRDTLRESMAAAVTEGVRAALVEVLNGGAVQSLLRGVLPTTPAPTPTAKPSLGARLLTKARSALGAVRAWVGGALQRIAGGLATVGRTIQDGVKAVFGWRWVRLLPVLTLVGSAAVALTLSASAWWTSLRGGLAAVGAGCAALARRLFQ